jgi:hypothetical protein
MKEMWGQKKKPRRRTRDERVGAMCVRDTGPSGQPRKDTRTLTVLLGGLQGGVVEANTCYDDARVITKSVRTGYETRHPGMSTA